MTVAELPKLICICGPTASGKTDLAIQIAKVFHTEIISVDSRQIYKELIIGSAMPTELQLKEIKHHFISEKNISENYSAGIFAQEAKERIKSLSKKYKYLILAGGSGLYFKALIEGLDQIPDSNSEIRNILNSQLKDEGLEKLTLELKKSDPEYYEINDNQNPARVLRALEVIRQSGNKYSDYLNQKSNKKSEYKTLFIGLKPERKLLYARINQRTDKMMAAGLLKEAESLHPFSSANALQTVGYKELFEYLNGLISLDEAVELIKRNTRRFAKRQMTWFRNQNPDIQWFDNSDSSEILKYIQEVEF